MFLIKQIDSANSPGEAAIEFWKEICALGSEIIATRTVDDRRTDDGRISIS